MAFKPTKGRGVPLQIGNLPNLSGYKEAAGQLSQLSQLAFNIGLDDRKRQYNDAILQAEIDGKTAGTKYETDPETGQMTLVPLTNLDYGKAASLFSASERADVLAKYRESAIGTYVTAKKLDIESQADRALLDSPDDPDKIRGVKSGVYESLNGLDDEVRVALSPIVENYFVRAENMALAQQQKNARDYAVDVNKKSFQSLNSELSVLLNKGDLNDDGINARIEEILQEQDQVIERLGLNGVSDQELESLQDSRDTFLFLEASNAHIERHYIATDNNYAEGLKEVERYRENLRAAGNIDADTIAASMESKLKTIHGVQQAFDKERSATQTSNYEQALLDLVLRKPLSNDDIQNLDITDGQKYTLIQASQNIQTSELNARKAFANEQTALYTTTFNRLMIPFKDEFGSEADRQRNAPLIQQMYIDGKIPPEKYSLYIAEENAIFKRKIATVADIGKADLEAKMSKSAGYVIAPSQFRAMTQTLIDRGVIGDLDGQMSLTTWQGKIDSYETSYKAFHKKAKADAAAISRVRNSDNPSAADFEVAARFAPQMEADELGQTLNHSDPAIRDENIRKAVEYTLSYNSFHPEVVNQLKGLNSIQDEETFNNKMATFNLVVDSIAKNEDMGIGYMKAMKIMKDQGIDVTSFEVARMFGYRQWNQAQSTSITVNPDRILNGLSSQFRDLDAAIQANWSDSTQGATWGEWFVNTLVPFYDTDNVEVLNMLDKITDSVPEELFINGDVGDAYIGDERLLHAIRLGVQSQFATKAIPMNDEGLRIAIRGALYDIADKVGITVDSEGTPNWTVNSWFTEAQKSIGDAANIIPSDLYGEDIGPVAGAVFSDIKAKFTALGSDNQKAMDLLNDDGVIFLMPNPTTGRAQTYRVMIRDADDPYQVETLFPSYRYEYHSSLQSKAYLAAQARVKSAPIKSLIGNFPVIGSYFNARNIRSEILDITEDLNSRKFSENFVELVSELVQIIDPNADLPDAKEIGFKIDEADVVILRDFLEGNFSNDEEYLKKLESLYE